MPEDVRRAVAAPFLLLDQQATHTRSEGRQIAGQTMQRHRGKRIKGMLFLFFSLFSMLEDKNENSRTQPRRDTPDGLPSPFAL